MLEDPVGVVTEPVKEITPEEAPMEQLVREPEEADTTSTGSEEAELFSRGGSALLVVVFMFCLYHHCNFIWK